MKIKSTVYLCVLLCVVALANGCAPAATPTPVPPTITPTPIPPLTLYLCSGFVLVERCEYKAGDQIAGRIGREQEGGFEYILDGDISGTTYTFNLVMDGGGTSNIQAQLIHKSGESESVLASASFIVVADHFKIYSQSVNGSDPTTKIGDKLILRVINESGDAAGLRWDGESFITIPFVKK